jgi:ADP-ribose pyrophosphatase
MEIWTAGPTEVHRGPVFSVLSGTVRLDDDTTATREVVHHQGSVAVVAIRADSALMISQFRIAVGKTVLEIPAGRIEKDETPEQAALRELEEETNYTGRLVPGPVYYSSVGFLDESVHIFFALDVVDKKANPDHDERIHHRWVPLSEVARGLRSYRFNDSKTIIGLREVLAFLDLNDQMVDDKSLYAWYSDENHKYNTLIWQFPVAIVGLNVIALERLPWTLPLMSILCLVNNVLLLCVAKHVYHQRQFTLALQKIANRFRTMQPNIPVVSFPRGGISRPLVWLKVTWLLFWSLFALNMVLFVVYWWRRPHL